MNILGINHFFHDATACIVSNGKLIVAIEEERLSRDKHTHSFPVKAINKCLEYAGLSFADIDEIAVSIKPQKDWHKKVWYGMQHISSVKSFARHELLNAFSKERHLRAWYNEACASSRKQPPIHYISHHQSHAAGSFLVSPFESSAILSLDGSGEWSTSFLGKGEGNKITHYHESYFPMSLGSFYEAATSFCGFRANYDEGKTMGLAPMGDPERFHKQVSKLVQIEDNGQISVDLSYFNYQFWGDVYFTQKFIDIFGKPREGDGEFEQHHLDIAAAFQRVLEDCALKLCAILKQKTQSKNLVLAGGVSLNSVMNGRIVKESEFDEIYVMPAAGDNGTAIGAAFYLYNCKLSHQRDFYHDDPFIGNDYTNEQIEAMLKESKLTYEYHENIEELGADLLHQGQILGWHQGRMEIGPRSLGNRSILANPSIAGVKDKINAEVKHREPYRPFAPSATVEGAPEFFEDLGDNPFMLKVCDVLPQARDLLPAITHVDGSARLQTVHKETNLRYHTLISELGKRNNVPVVLNTSFNIMGEPMVESPFDAIRCFFTTGIDSLLIGNFLIKK